LRGELEIKKDFDLVVAELDKFKVCFKKILYDYYE